MMTTEEFRREFIRQFGVDPDTVDAAAIEAIVGDRYRSVVQSVVAAAVDQHGGADPVRRDDVTMRILQGLAVVVAEGGELLDAIPSDPGVDRLALVAAHMREVYGFPAKKD